MGVAWFRVADDQVSTWYQTELYSTNWNTGWKSQNRSTAS